MVEQSKSQKTLLIEQMLQDGQSISSIAREFDISRARVHHIKSRLLKSGVTCNGVTPLQPHHDGLVFSNQSMKSLNIRLTTPVFDALTEACAITNRKDRDDPITVEDYVEECLTTRLVELGLIRKRKC